MAQSKVGLHVAVVLVAHAQAVVRGKLEIHSRRDARARLRRDHSIIEGGDGQRGVKDEGIDNRRFLHITLLHVQEEGSFPIDRAADVSSIILSVVVRRRARERVPCVKKIVVVHELDLAMELVSTRFGEDLDPSESDAVELR